jgi:large subunit ribosomal protein L4
MVQLALHSALSDRASDSRVVVVDRWDFAAPKTRDAKGALAALGIADGRVLLVIDRDDEIAYKAFRNLPEVQPIFASELNAYDILCNDWVVFTRATLPGAAGGDGSANVAERTLVGADDGSAQETVATETVEDTTPEELA